MWLRESWGPLHRWIMAVVVGRDLKQKKNARPRREKPRQSRQGRLVRQSDSLECISGPNKAQTLIITVIKKLQVSHIFKLQASSL
jgi:hypothetical protein